MIITEETMFAPVLEQCPQFINWWNEFVAEYENEPYNLPLYLISADFARYIVDVYNSRDLKAVEVAFNIIESWVVDGDEYVRTCAVIGVLEQLQNTNITGDIDMNLLMQFTGPISRKYWFKIIDFWGNGILITDV